MPAPLDLKKQTEKDRWADEDADEDDIKESWEDEEPTPVFFIDSFFEAKSMRSH